MRYKVTIPVGASDTAPFRTDSGATAMIRPLTSQTRPSLATCIFVNHIGRPRGKTVVGESRGASGVIFALFPDLAATASPKKPQPMAL